MPSPDVRLHIAPCRDEQIPILLSSRDISGVWFEQFNYVISDPLCKWGAVRFPRAVVAWPHLASACNFTCASLLSPRVAAALRAEENTKLPASWLELVSVFARRAVAKTIRAPEGLQVVGTTEMPRSLVRQPGPEPASHVMALSSLHPAVSFVRLA